MSQSSGRRVEAVFHRCPPDFQLLPVFALRPVSLLSFLPLALSPLLPLLLSGCAPEPRKAALIVAVEQDPSSLDPRIGSDVAADRAFRLLYRSLFLIGPDFKPEPDLVETWSQPSPTTYRFTLKTGVRFSDGRALTARDAAYTLDTVRSGAVPSFKKGDLDRISSITVASPNELVVELHEPLRGLPFRAQHRNYSRRSYTRRRSRRGGTLPPRPVGARPVDPLRAKPILRNRARE